MTIKTRLDLKQDLAPRFGVLDQHFVSVMKNRLNLAERVAAYKILNNDPIVRREIELGRLKTMREQGVALGMDPNFIISLGYPIIGESCKVQIELYQAAAAAGEKSVDPETESELRAFYRKNLLELTGIVAAAYDEHYSDDRYATQDYVRYEWELIEQKLTGDGRGVLLDLGCATGRMTLPLASRFTKAIGIDVSPQMLEIAHARVVDKGLTNVTFKEADLEKSLDLDDASVSFVLMNMGTASDIHDFAGLLREVRRVLAPGGRFLFSFYNKEALVYAWDFLPWPVALAAEINVTLNCLEVQRDHRLYSLYARPYTISEVEDILPTGLSLTEITTFPTVSPLLPHELLRDVPKAQRAVQELDRSLATGNQGAYIVVTGVRT